MQVKVKTFRMPNLDIGVFGGYEELEDTVKNYIKNKLEDGWTLNKAVGGDCYLILIFTKA